MARSCSRKTSRKSHKSSRGSKRRVEFKSHGKKIVFMARKRKTSRPLNAYQKLVKKIIKETMKDHEEQIENARDPAKASLKFARQGMKEAAKQWKKSRKSRSRKSRSRK